MRSPEKEFLKSIQVVGAIIAEPRLASAEGKILLVQRGQGDIGEGLWEFPGGKIERGESPQQALRREIDEELNLQIEIVTSLGKLVHTYPKVRVELEVFFTHFRSGEIILREHQNMKWVKPREIIQDDLLEADRPFVQRLVEYLK